jgi:hypothetical protein
VRPGLRYITRLGAFRWEEPLFWKSCIPLDSVLPQLVWVARAFPDAAAFLVLSKEGHKDIESHPPFHAYIFHLLRRILIVSATALLSRRINHNK